VSEVENLQVGTEAAFHAVLRIVNETSANLPITLQIAGSLVSGTLIPSSQYNHAQALAHASQASGEAAHVAEALGQVFAQRVVAEKANGFPDLEFAYLEKAQIFNGMSKGVPTGGVLWQLKTSSVEGFFFGKLAET